MSNTEERTIGQKLKDARSAQREARRVLGRAITQAEDANAYVHTRRAKLDLWDDRVNELQAAWDAGQRALGLAAALAATPIAKEAAEPLVTDVTELLSPEVASVLAADFWDCVWCQSKEHKSFECPKQPATEAPDPTEPEELPAIQPPAPAQPPAAADDDFAF